MQIAISVVDLIGNNYDMSTHIDETSNIMRGSLLIFHGKNQIMLRCFKYERQSYRTDSSVAKFDG